MQPSLETVIDILLAMVNAEDLDWIDIEKSANHICSRTIRAPINVPPFKRSKVDGYAISAEDLDKNVPLTLPKTKIIPAGETKNYAIKAGTTIKLMTGALVPSGTGAIIKQEEVEEHIDEIKTKTIPDYNANIEFIGSSIKKEQIILNKGEKYNPLLIERIANTGINELPIYSKPIVSIMNTGSELQLPGSSIAYGEIFNSNRSMFLNLLELAACEGRANNRKIPDEIGIICTEIKTMLQKSDLLIITGGNSEGDFDLIDLALDKIGAEKIVTGIEMRPGHKTLVASYNNKLIFNVSGNPRAGYILFNVLIKPILNKMKGASNPLNNWFDIELLNDIDKSVSIRTFSPGYLIQENEKLGAIVQRKSGANYGLAGMILDIAPNKGNKGDLVKALLV
ncbi:MAG TPA: molybdopterin molybdotransferase MoeA [Syntrophomonadaceae bacterium]|nr:molybdopterin molybdotransferase MoeA [Syntrophomonadaceae bacterium]